MTHWWDIGVNLTDKRLAKRTEILFANASEVGVNHWLLTATDIASSKACANLCAGDSGVTLYCTAGVHPHQAKDAGEDLSDSLLDLAAYPQVRAIGECGLDYNRDFSPRNIQRAVFEQQLEVAAQCGLPVFLHERDAFDDQIAILQRYRHRLVGGVAHCFTGNAEQMQAYLSLDLHIGITGWLCDEQRGTSLREAVQHLPMERVLLETDAPYLTPKDIRPRPKLNQPALVPHIAGTLAGLRGWDLQELARVSSANAQELFGDRQ